MLWFWKKKEQSPADSLKQLKETKDEVRAFSQRAEKAIAAFQRELDEIKKESQFNLEQAEEQLREALKKVSTLANEKAVLESTTRALVASNEVLTERWRAEKAVHVMTRAKEQEGE